jgi:hypothetical protein
LEICFPIVLYYHFLLCEIIPHNWRERRSGEDEETERDWLEAGG